LLLGRNADLDLNGLPVKAAVSAQGRLLSFNAQKACRVLPPDGVYRVTAYGFLGTVRNSDTVHIETVVSVQDRIIIVSGMNDNRFKPVRLEFLL
jgi:hypothetical protein